MNSFEINKILGALLGTCLVCLPCTSRPGRFSRRPCRRSPVTRSWSRKSSAGQAAASQAPAEQPIETLLASASAERGAQVAKQCDACHNFQEGQGPKVGPDLYGVVGRPVASVPGFNYSAALKAKGGTWTFDALNKWLTDPRADVPGTAMTFAGLTNEKQRADVIAYLDTLSRQSGAAAEGGCSQPPPAQTRQPPRPPARRPGGPPAPCAAAQPAIALTRLRFRRPAHADVKCIWSRRTPARWRRN